MQYRRLKQCGPELSLLGFGCMRFPTKSGVVDKQRAFELLDYALKRGVNYFDTAYIYHGGKSESIVGEFAKTYNVRDKMYIADKLPCYFVKKPEQIERFFITQLERLDTHYIDYYLMHTLFSYADWQKLKDFGIEDFVERKKQTGEIRNIGFSFHGRPEEFIKILEDYPWDFCQIQYNYLDEHYQAGLAGLKRAHELSIGVIIMEPLRGGALANKVPPPAAKIFASYPEKRSHAFWAMRFVMNRPEVSVVLSGMNELSQIDDNIAAAMATQPNSMSNYELTVISEVKRIFSRLLKIPCTACNYCMPCPFGVDIPGTFSEYNLKYLFGSSLMTRFQYAARCVGALPGDASGANLCTKCGKCTSHCPQAIDIPHRLAMAHDELSNPLLTVAARAAKLFIKNKPKKDGK